MTTTTVTVNQARTQLSELLRRVEAGEEIVIARGKRPIALLKSYDEARGAEVSATRAAGLGAWSGRIVVKSDDAFAPLTDDEIGETFGRDFRDPTTTRSAPLR